MAYTFILTDESVNSYGFQILTAGIRTERFEKNPVMLYMHGDEKGVIGRWENLRKEGGKLLADAVFDESCENGMEIKKKVENNFLRAVSIGIDNIEMDKNTETVTGCDLVEASIVSIPANQNAVRLYGKSGRILMGSKNLEGDEVSFRSQMIGVLELPENSSDKDILDALRKLKKNEPSPEKKVDQALRFGLIDPSQTILLKGLAKYDRRAFGKYLQERKEMMSAEINKKINSAVQKGQVLSFETDVLKEIGHELGIKTLDNLLCILPGKTSFISLLKNQTLSDRGQWGLQEYRKFAPEELRTNPDLYAELVKKEREKKENVGEEIPDYKFGYDLDYYRKNDPQFLADNPDEYKRLLKQKKSQKHI